MTRPILSDAFEHHCWATLQLLDACSSLTDEQLASTVPGTYGSIIETLRHLVGADRSYAVVLSKGAVGRVDESAMNVAELRTVMAENAPAWDAVVAGGIDADEVLVRHRDDGSESHAPAGVRLAQVLHHGTDHRSQVCTALTGLGIEPPAIDVWDYAWTQGRLVEVPAPQA